ncbi:uncharacterized protein VP01_2010g3 [Puccinia sorghi]|uniref:DDE Tnp4 domain-containing protein n=1 Tax=Puccinia sorghi TaxID=27349 RepID=A0A0L6VB57_9BASI|nr:uncharacterized protein VP01_2010g3 [Puccinia sorghi]
MHLALQHLVVHASQVGGLHVEPSNQFLSNNQHDFKINLSGVRVVVENFIGLLKNRFQSFKGLRLCVSNRKDFIQVNYWIILCAILHNFLNKVGDEFNFSDFEPE